MTLNQELEMVTFLVVSQKSQNGLLYTGETRHLALQRGDIYVHSSVNFIFHHFLDIQSKNCGDYLRLNGLKLNLNILNKSSLQIGKMGPFSI